MEGLQPTITTKSAEAPPPSFSEAFPPLPEEIGQRVTVPPALMHPATGPGCLELWGCAGESEQEIESTTTNCFDERAAHALLETPPSVEFANLTTPEDVIVSMLHRLSSQMYKMHSETEAKISELDAKLDRALKQHLTA